jgi:hypothetical protein
MCATASANTSTPLYLAFCMCSVVLFYVRYQVSSCMVCWDMRNLLIGTTRSQLPSSSMAWWYEEVRWPTSPKPVKQSRHTQRVWQVSLLDILSSRTYDYQAVSTTAACKACTITQHSSVFLLQLKYMLRNGTWSVLYSLMLCTEYRCFMMFSLGFVYTHTTTHTQAIVIQHRLWQGAWHACMHAAHASTLCSSRQQSSEFHLAVYSKQSPARRTTWSQGVCIATYIDSGNSRLSVYVRLVKGEPSAHCTKYGGTCT